MIALVAGFIVSLIASLMLIRYQHLHGHLTADHDTTAIQKFHSKPVPRVGGVGIIIGALVALMVKCYTESPDIASFGFLLIISSMPIFFAGLLEDLTKCVGIRTRLFAAFASAAVAGVYSGIWITRLDIPVLDGHLLSPSFSVSKDLICIGGASTFLFTVFAVGGVSNSFNLIDGYNGLASVVSMLILLGVIYVADQVGDRRLVITAIAFLGAIAGFAVWNYPNGLIFLGDSGAYLIGFVVAELSVALVARNSVVSAWFPLLLSLYPIYETIFTIYRRVVIGKRNPGHPDAAHLHQLVYRRLVRWAEGDNDDRHAAMTLRNALTSPYLWVMASFAVLPAVLFWRDTKGFSDVLCGKWVQIGTGFWKGLAGRFASFPTVRKMMFVRLRNDLNPLALTIAA